MEDVAKIKLQFVKKENLISAPISAEISNRRPGACSRKYDIHHIDLMEVENEFPCVLYNSYVALLLYGVALI